MSAKEILEEIRQLEYKRAKESGYKRLSREEEAPFREWKIKRYTEAIEIDPLCGDAYAGRGSELYFLGRRAEAKADMRKAFELGASDPDQYMFISMPFEGDEKREILRAGMAKVDRSTQETAWVYDHLNFEFVKSYWYDGNFAENARLLEQWVSQLQPTEHMYRMALHDLGMAYSALERHADAEIAYRKALAATPEAEKYSVADMVVRTLMHRNSFAAGRTAVAELRSDLSPDAYAMFDAVLAVLQDTESADAQVASAAALAVAEERGRRPGPMKTTTYSSFLLGIIYRGLGRKQEAADILTRFADESAANKREWAVTLRWEIAKARELASMT